MFRTSPTCLIVCVAFAIGQARDCKAQRRGGRNPAVRTPTKVDLARSQAIRQQARASAEAAAARHSARQRDVELREGVLRRNGLEAWWYGTVATAGTGKVVVAGKTTAGRSAGASFLHFVVLIQKTGTDLAKLDRKYMLTRELLKTLAYRLPDEFDCRIYVARDDNSEPVIIGTDETEVRLLAESNQLRFTGPDETLTLLMERELFAARQFKKSWEQRLKQHELEGNPCPDVLPPWESSIDLEFLEGERPWPTTPGLLKSKQRLSSIRSELNATVKEINSLQHQRDILLQAVADKATKQASMRVKSLVTILDQIDEQQKKFDTLYNQLLTEMHGLTVE